jgi:acetyl esterase/lipase
MSEPMNVISDIIYAQREGRALHLDLYRPAAEIRALPVIVWIHGGAWMAGSYKTDVTALSLVPHGYAVASVQYRFSQEAIFPAQIHDCKEAVRWLRAHAAEYGLDGARIGAWGPSAGGHLVSLLGTSGGVAALEGEGDYRGVSSRVQAVCDWFGPTDFLQMSAHAGDSDHDAPDSPESRLVGGAIQEHPERVAAANPITYVSGDEPPFLIMHGDEDMTVPHHQSVLLYEALCGAGIEATMRTLTGAGHGGKAFHTAAVMDEVIGFFSRHLCPT